MGPKGSQLGDPIPKPPPLPPKKNKHMAQPGFEPESLGGVPGEPQKKHMVQPGFEPRTSPSRAPPRKPVNCELPTRETKPIQLQTTGAIPRNPLGVIFLFFVHAHKLSAYALTSNKLGGNPNATPSALGVPYFLPLPRYPTPSVEVPNPLCRGT